MQCTYCGAEMRDDSVLCTACGRLTPEYERNYRRPDPTIGGSRRRDNDLDDLPRRDRRVSRGGVIGGGTRSLDGVPERSSRKPRTLILVVLGAIAALFAFAVVAGMYLPREMTEAYREAVEWEEQNYDVLPSGDYEDVVSAYFDYAEENDAYAIRALFAEPLREEDIEDLDSWSICYGDAIDRYTITEVTPYDEDELEWIADNLEADVDQYVDIKVSVRFEVDDYDTHYDLDAVEIDGDWYLIYIW